MDLDSLPQRWGSCHSMQNLLPGRSYSLIMIKFEFLSVIRVMYVGILICWYYCHLQIHTESDMLWDRSKWQPMDTAWQQLHQDGLIDQVCQWRSNLTLI